jgi:hypothetical protein
VLVTAGAILGILFSIVTIGGGTVVLILRRRVAAWNARVNRDSFGKFGERVAQNSTPGWVTAIGIGLILVGVVSLLRVLFPGS